MLESTAMPRIELERVEEAQDLSQSSSESFDRLAFAERALALVRPPRTTVAICGGAKRVHLEAGPQWGAPRGERWAILTISTNASRRAIASAVLELGAGARARPWALDVLLGHCEGPYRCPGRDP